MILPRWVELLSETSNFDPGGDWCRIVCTGRGHHQPELLGLVFEDADRGRLWAGPHVHLTRVDDGQAIDMDDVLRPSSGPSGAVNLTCPSCRRTPRCTRDQWSRLTDTLAIPGMFDASSLP